MTTNTKTTDIEIPLTSNQLLHTATKTYRLRMPNDCPHCGSICAPRVIAHDFLDLSISAEYTNLAILSVALITNCCNNIFYVFYKSNKEDSKTEFMSRYPNTLSQPINSALMFSNDFVALYQQATTSEKMGHKELASIGYRNALESLLKDYAVVHLARDYEEAIAMPLAQCVREFLPILNLNNYPQLAQYLADDYAFNIAQMPGFSFSQLKNLVAFMLNAISSSIDVLGLQALEDDGVLEEEVTDLLEG